MSNIIMVTDDEGNCFWVDKRDLVKVEPPQEWSVADQINSLIRASRQAEDK